MKNLPDILFERYGKSHLSYSSIKNALNDMALFDAYMTRQITYTSDALKFGSLYDMLIFDRDKAIETYTILDHDLIMERCSVATQSTKSPKATKEYKEVKEALEFELAESGKIICTKEEYDIANDMVNRLVECGLMDSYLKGEYQVPVYFTLDGAEIKGALDCLGDGFISDSKSSKSVDGFRYDVNKFCYDLQAYLYTQATGIKEFYWVVQEKTFPYLPALVKCSEETLFKGEMKYHTALARIKQFLDSGKSFTKDYVEYTV